MKIVFLDVKTIGEDIVGDWDFWASDFTVKGYTDSYAQTYANEKGYSLTLADMCVRKLELLKDDFKKSNGDLN